MPNAPTAPFTLVIGNRNYSSWSLRGWLMLRQTGVDFEEIQLPLDTPEFEEKIAALSPSRRVPALIHGSTTIWDSLAIGEYLAERSPTLWPVDPEARAFARCISAEMHAGFVALRQALPMNGRARGRTVRFGKDVQADVTRIASIWTEARKRFAPAGPWLCGSFSIADCMYAPIASRFFTYGIALDGAAAAYGEAIRNHPDMRAWTESGCKETQVLTRDEVGK
ncbi:MAG: glutathione S-transferase family protein [Nannocystaceae bacterium]